MELMDDETEHAILEDLATMGDGETKVPEDPKNLTVEQIAIDLTTSLMQAFMTNALVATRKAVRQHHAVHQIMELPDEINPICPGNKLFVERLSNQERDGHHFAYWDGRFANTKYAIRLDDWIEREPDYCNSCDSHYWRRRNYGSLSTSYSGNEKGNTHYHSIRASKP